MLLQNIKNRKRYTVIYIYIYLIQKIPILFNLLILVFKPAGGITTVNLCIHHSGIVA